jgi:hypothetical protein
MSEEEIIRIFGKIFDEYQKDPAKEEKIERYKRKYSRLTENDLLKMFTI